MSSFQVTVDQSEDGMRIVFDVPPAAIEAFRNDCELLRRLAVDAGFTELTNDPPWVILGPMFNAMIQRTITGLRSGEITPPPRDEIPHQGSG